MVHVLDGSPPHGPVVVFRQLIVLGPVHILNDPPAHGRVVCF